MPASHARWSEPRDQRISTGAPSLPDPARESELPLREAYPLTGFDSGDDLDLRALCIGRKSQFDRVYWGPQLLFNATHRRSDCGGIAPRALELESFFLSPLYCGSQSFGYARTENAKPAGDVDPNLSLGRALGISAAAGNPSNSPSSRPVTALLTLACAQPGAWLEKPKPEGWSAAGPNFGDLPVATSFGSTSDAGDFVFLTGGDDFERLGVYELVRRRCRYIIAVDAGEFGSNPGARLANLIEQCRLDFGLRVDVDTRPPNRVANEGASSVHVAVGQIHYEDVDQGGMPGVLIYVGMLHEERTAFGQTLDAQQFECCRLLGTHAAGVAFGDVVTRLTEKFPGLAQQTHIEYAPKLFAEIVRRLTEAIAGEVSVPSPGGHAESQPVPASGRGRGRSRAVPDADGGAGPRS